jgi:hypothetical protein
MNRAEMNQVRLAVRRYVAKTPRFTTRQLVAAMGKNQESLRTELSRLKKEGIITSEPMPASSEDALPGKQAEGRKKRVGAPCVQYVRTQEPAALEALHKSILAFHDRLPEDYPDRPRGVVFLEACEAINEAAHCEDDDARREELLAEAREGLEYVRDMNSGPGVKESWLTFLNFEFLRIAYLEKQYQESLKPFEEGAKQFEAAGETLTTQQSRDYAAACKYSIEIGANLDKKKLMGQTERFRAAALASHNPLVIIARKLTKTLLGASDFLEKDNADLREQIVNLKGEKQRLIVGAGEVDTKNGRKRARDREALDAYLSQKTEDSFDGVRLHPDQRRVPSLVGNTVGSTPQEPIPNRRIGNVGQPAFLAGEQKVPR